MKRSVFHVEQMDCSTEEQIIRLRLDGMEGIVRLEFDLDERRLVVVHDGSHQVIGDALASLNLGAVAIEQHDDVEAPMGADDNSNRGPLTLALAINASLFVVELVTGLLAGSMGLVADSLDMLADAFVYALSLAAVGRDDSRKRRAATLSAYLQGCLALLGLGEVVRRFANPAGAPDALPMIGISVVALAANVATLLILRRTKRGEAHIEASWIFTSNDIKVNALVIVAGLMVWWSQSQVPDLLAGGMIFLIVANGARRILALARAASRDDSPGRA